MDTYESTDSMTESTSVMDSNDIALSIYLSFFFVGKVVGKST